MPTLKHLLKFRARAFRSPERSGTTSLSPRFGEAGRQDGQARPRPAGSESAHAPKKAEPAPAAALSNEALEKRLEEILQ